MKIFQNGKLKVELSDNNVLSISQKSGDCCSKTVTESTCKLEDVVEMLPNSAGTAVALATTNDQFYLEMKKDAVSQVVNRWKLLNVTADKELLFQTKRTKCFITPDGTLIFHNIATGSCCCISYASKEIYVLAISLADVILKDVRKNSYFMATERHAIEIKGLQQEDIERLDKLVKKYSPHISSMKVYNRAFKITLIPEVERIYTTTKGVGRYYKKGTKTSDFSFTPWDKIQLCKKTKGCCRCKMLIVGELPVITECKFSTNDVKDIVSHVNKNVEKNAGSGNMYGRGSNKVYVTDSHVLCIGKKRIIALEKPYNDGKLIDKSWCSSVVSLDGFEVKVGRHAWKGFCCSKGKLYDDVTACPSREIKEEAERHRF